MTINWNETSINASYCCLQWHGEMPLSLREKCIWLSILTCCAPVPWHRWLSCFTGSLLARCQNPLSLWNDALFGTCCTMASIQGFDETCAANTSEKSVRMRDHHPLFPIFFPYFHQCHHPTLAATVHVHCPLWPDLKFKAMLNFKLWYSDLSSAKTWSSKSAHTHKHTKCALVVLIHTEKEI